MERFDYQEQKGRIFIGTSNIVVPGNKQSFPPEFQAKSRLHYYGTFFNSLEVNSSFYKTPMPSTYMKWAEEVPARFQFTIKLSKELTHAKDLQSDLAIMDRFIQAARGLGGKKGCLLIQFPGKVTLEHFSKVETLLAELEVLDPNQDWRRAVEFRHRSWFIGEAYELLNEHAATMVLQDHAKAKMMDDSGKATFVYIRLHGPKGDYRDSYPDKFLSQLAVQVQSWSTEGKDVYVYFNNTIGDAFNNALTLQRFLSL